MSGTTTANSLLPSAVGGPGGAQVPLQAPGPALPDRHLQTLGSVRQQAQAHFDAVEKAVGRMDRVREQLSLLGEKGDVVTPEDVVESAGKLVGAGEDPLAIAGLLADMPEAPGEQLAAWVGQHAATTAVKEAQLEAVATQARHALAVASLHNIMAHSLTPAGQGPAMQPAAAPNSLLPSPSNTGAP